MIFSQGQLKTVNFLFYNLSLAPTKIDPVPLVHFYGFFIGLQGGYFCLLGHLEKKWRLKLLSKATEFYKTESICETLLYLKIQDI